jgi:phospholipid/cholesterol/gamma-HCH transport system substrate-binding protein
MRESILETLIGAAVLVVAGVFLWFAMISGGEASSSSSGSVELGARFNSVSGVERGTDVRMAGVKVGTVRAIELNVERAEALVTLAVSEDLVPLGDGTTARIQSEGLLGGNYINLEPAAGYGEIEPCGDGQELFGDSGCGEVLYTQGSVDLLTLMASFANNSGGGDNSGNDTGSSAGESDGDESYPADPVNEEPAAEPGSEDTVTATESSDSSASSEETDPSEPGDDE